MLATTAWRSNSKDALRTDVRPHDDGASSGGIRDFEHEDFEQLATCVTKPRRLQLRNSLLYIRTLTQRAAAHLHLKATRTRLIRQLVLWPSSPDVFTRTRFIRQASG